MFVRLGEHDIVEKEGTEFEYAVEDVRLHPDYNADTVDNDVALLKIPVLKDQETADLPADGTFPDSSIWGDSNFRKNLRQGKRYLHNTRAITIQGKSDKHHSKSDITLCR